MTIKQVTVPSMLHLRGFWCVLFSFALWLIPAPLHAQQFSENLVTTSATGVQEVSTADIDEDGDTDVLAAVFDDNRFLWYENQNDTSFVQHEIAAADGAFTISAVDVNGDGHTDVLTGSVREGTIAWYKNDGSGSFSGSNVIDGNAGAPYSVYAAPLNSDDHLDILAAAFEQDRVMWYENKGDDTFAAATVISGSEDGVRSVFAADLDGNGTKDALSASEYDGTVAWYVNTGGIFHAQTIQQGVGGPADIYATDVNGDDNPDVISAAIDDNEITLYLNSTDGGGNVSFARQVVSTSAKGAQSVYATDIGEDGDVDLLSASRLDDKIALYENDGTASFTERIVSDSADGATSVSGADMDGDGNADVLSASQRDNTIRWYETNLSPVARDTSFEVEENSTLQMSVPGVLGNDSDPDEDILRAVRLTRPSEGAVSAFRSDGTFTFDPGSSFDSLAVGENDRLSFRYEAHDESGLADTATVEVVVQGVNDSPVARPDSDTTEAGATVVTAVLPNDSDVDGQPDPATVSVADLPQHGSVSAAGSGEVTYTPNEGFVGSDRYAYVVGDGEGGLDTAQVRIDVSPGPPRALRARGGNQRVHLRWRPPQRNVQAYRIYWTTPTDEHRGPPLTVIEDSSTTEYEATDLTNRQVYDFHVTAVGPGGVEGTADTVRAIPRPLTLALEGTISFGSSHRTTGYRMVGLPGAPDGTKLTSTLDGEQGDTWTAFAAPGITASEELVGFGDEPSQFSFETGRGFWVLSEKPWAPTGEVSTVEFAESATAAIDIPEGWSIITNPFPKSVSWKQVQIATPGFEAALWGFDGEYSARSTLQPYEGYYVFNDPGQAVDTLRVPYPIEVDSGESKGLREQVGGNVREKSFAAEEKYSLVLRATAKKEGKQSGTEASMSEVQVRIGKEAAEGKDSTDRFAPPLLRGEREGLRLILRGEEVSEAYPWLSREARPLGPDETATFDLQLSGPAGAGVYFSVRNIRGLSENAVYLYDQTTERVFNLRKEVGTVQLGGVSGQERRTRRLEVWVGARERLEERRKAKAPVELALRPPVPNPTSSTARLQYTIPSSAAPVEAEIIVYDVLGREVQRLIDGRRTEGRYVVEWKGEDTRGRRLASGVYFFRFIAGEKTVDTRKISLVR